MSTKDLIEWLHRQIANPSSWSEFDPPDSVVFAEIANALASQAAEIERLREALEWYAEQARLCRLITSEGDAGRHALSDDGGKRARAALNGEKA